MASVLPPTRAVAFTITFPIFNTSGKLLTGCTFTSTQVSLDNGSFASATNAPAELATSSGVYTLALTASEMTADEIAVKMVVATASAQDVTVIIYTTLRRSDDHAYPAIALTEGYAADGVAPTLEQMLFQLWSALAEFSISGTTVTAKKLDGSTTAMTFTLNDATNPTSRTRTT